MTILSPGCYKPNRKIEKKGGGESWVELAGDTVAWGCGVGKPVVEHFKASQTASGFSWPFLWSSFWSALIALEAGSLL